MAVIREPVCGLVLSGGGARGLAHIGVIKVLERAGIPIHLVAGSSMGGIVAAGYARGMSGLELEKAALEITKPHNLLGLVDLNLPRQGLLSGTRVRDYLAKVIGHDVTFEDLALPLGLMTVDLVKGEEVLLREGLVLDAVRATMAFPGVFDPVTMGDRRLADGGILNDFPVDAARRMGAEVVIGVDVGIDYYDLDLADNPKTNPVTRVTQTAWRAMSLSMRSLQALKIREARPDVILRPAIPHDITVFNGFHRAAEIIRVGEEAAETAIRVIERKATGRRLLLKPRVEL